MVEAFDQSRDHLDEAVRTGDPLFTNQGAIEFSCQLWLSMKSKDSIASIEFHWLGYEIGYRRSTAPDPGRSGTRDV
jgi:hypothetical protein